MSTKQKTKTKPKTPAKKQKAKVTRKPSAQAKKPEKHVPEVRPEKIEKPKEETKETKQVAPQKTFLVAVRLLGSITVPYDDKSTLQSLGLIYRFNARLLEKNDSTMGMLRHAKDYVTWGEVGPQEMADLLRKHARLTTGSQLTDAVVKEKFGQESIGTLVSALIEGKITLRALWDKDVNPTLRLHAPSDGFRASVKRPFTSLGELGYRGHEISNLLARM
jgi:50S ribosomal protein uL30